MRGQLRDASADALERQPIFQKDLEVLDVTLKMLREKAAHPDGQPWAICSAFVLPHPPWKARKDILARYRGKGDLPFNREGAGRDICDQYTQKYYGDLAELSDEEIRNAREVYFALITEFDEYAGMILDCLAECGLDDNTVVLYFSDHGEMAGEHGLWAKTTLLEASARVPMIVRWPGRIRPGTRSAVPVSLVDLYPTFLDIAGTHLPEPLKVDGHSLVPLLEGRREQFQGGEVFCEFEGEGWNHPRAFLRVGDYKYVHNHTADERLYDLNADPYEMNDLSSSPQHAATLSKLRSKLLAKLGASQGGRAGPGGPGPPADRPEQACLPRPGLVRHCDVQDGGKAGPACAAATEARYGRPRSRIPGIVSALKRKGAFCTGGARARRSSIDVATIQYESARSLAGALPACTPVDAASGAWTPLTLPSCSVTASGHGRRSLSEGRVTGVV